jgi:pimeloyl-ACP methyl ester carboxylesterase
MKNLFAILLLPIFIVSCGGTESVENEVDQIIEADTTQSENEIAGQTYKPTYVEFPSADGLIISGTIHQIDETSPSILLCHQAGFNMHEYDEIAPKLNALGFNCIAIDQRSGGILHDYVNQTADRAITEGFPIKYIDAEQDMVAAIDYTYNYFNQNVILWGSSYSSALALHIAANNEKVKAVVSFSPGDYFEDAKPLLKTTMLDMDLPYFITSSRDEAVAISDFLRGRKPSENQIHFIPKASGTHGSRALWETDPAHEEYWAAVESFLENF